MYNLKNIKKRKEKSMFQMLILGCGAGIFSALIAVFYRLALGAAEDFRANMFERINSAAGALILLAIFVGAGLLTGYISKNEPLIKGSGIPQVEGQLMGYFSPSWLKIIIKKFITGVICIGAGLSLGREGPSVQLGGMAGQGFAEITKVEGADRKYLIVCGACAGLAAAFNAPLAGLMFALEEIHKNFSRRAVFPAMAAAMCADIVSKLFFGKAAVLHMVKIDTLPLRYYALYILMGVLCGAAGAFYNKVLFAMQALYKKLPVSDVVRITIPFVVAAVAGFTFPEIMGGGHDIIEVIAAGQLGLTVLIALLIGKFIFSMISFCSGAPGGIFFPLLVLGALAGSIVGETGVFTFGFPDSYVINFMLLGMAGMFAGIVKAPLTGIILVAEMSGSLTQFIGLAMVSCISCLTASMLKSRPIYEQMLENMMPAEVRSRKEKDLAMMEVSVPFGSRADGRAIKDLELPGSCHIVGVSRYEVSMIPNGGTIIRQGDVLTIVYRVGTENDILDIIEIE